MGRIIEDIADRTGLDNSARIHHRHAIAHARDHAEVMGDEQDRHVGVLLQFLEQVQILQLDRYVQGRRGLVGDQHARPAVHGDGADHPLLHATAQLVRILVNPLFGRREFDLAQHLDGLLHDALAAPGALRVDHFGQLVADGEHRVQRGLRVLQDHRDLAPPNLPHLPLALGKKILALQQYLALHGPGGFIGQQAHQRQGGDALAAAGLADQAQHLAAVQRKADAIDGLYDATAQEEMGVKVPHLEGDIPVHRRTFFVVRPGTAGYLTTAAVWGPGGRAASPRTD